MGPMPDLDVLEKRKKISCQRRWGTGVGGGFLGGIRPPPPPPRNSEGPPKSCQTQPDCENC